MKPIRFGYKLWRSASSNGSLIHVEPYCGSSTHIDEAALGQGGNVVIGLLDKAGISECHTVTMDNFFTSCQLFDVLTNRGIGVTGTLCENQLQGIPLTNKKVFQKMSERCTRGICFWQTLVVKWNDNHPVIVLTNFESLKPQANGTRWSVKDKKHIILNVAQPILAYNKRMGGVDLFDQMLAC